MDFPPQVTFFSSGAINVVFVLRVCCQSIYSYMYVYVAVLSCECHIDTTKWKPLENWSIHQRHIYGSFLICIHVGPSAAARPESVWSLCKDNYYFFFYVAQNIPQHQSILLVVDILIPCYAHIICSSNYSGALQLNERNSSFATSWRTRFLCVYLR